MMRALQLLLPALLPSWGFFDYIQPSPRIQYQLLDAQQQPVTAWQEFRPRAQHLSLTTMLCHLLSNARWNETLFTMSCAERIAQHYNSHSENQILECIARDWRHGELPAPSSACQLQFRLAFVQRQQQQLADDIRFTSRIAALEPNT
jgi:hypothetical protein